MIEVGYTGVKSDEDRPLAKIRSVAGGLFTELVLGDQRFLITKDESARLRAALQEVEETR